MTVWVLVWLLSAKAPRDFREFYLSSRECELAQEQKAKPDQWGCQPKELKANGKFE